MGITGRRQSGATERVRAAGPRDANGWLAPSADPTTGLQPEGMPNAAWDYASAPTGRIREPYTPQRERDLTAERGGPHCTGCGAALDPKWCGIEPRTVDAQRVIAAAVIAGSVSALESDDFWSIASDVVDALNTPDGQS